MCLGRIDFSLIQLALSNIFVNNYSNSSEQIGEQKFNIILLID
jgi:hypothetical protein